MGRKAAAALACGLLALAGAGCYTSAFPLDETPQAELDAGLLGEWRCLAVDASAQEPPMSLVVGKARDRVYSIRLQGEGEEPESYEAHASKVGGRVVLNVRQIDEKPPSKEPWVFVRYALLRPDVLSFGIAQDEALRGVERTPRAIRGALERLAESPALFPDNSVCARVRERSRVGP